MGVYDKPPNDCTMPSLDEKTKMARLLEAHMKRRNLSITGFTARLGVSRGAVNSWLDGTAYPSRTSQELIAKELGLTLQELESEISGVPLKQTRSTDEILQNIRLMPIEDFILVLQVCFDRILKELAKAASKPN